MSYLPTLRPRVPKFETAEELNAKIEEYFEFVKENFKPATITGLAYYLGFASRTSFYDYERNPDLSISYTIKRARLQIESLYEEALFTAKNPAGPIFGLKNFGWRDEQTFNIMDERNRIAEAFPEEIKEAFELLGNVANNKSESLASD